LYNRFLAQRKAAYEQTGKSLPPKGHPRYEQNTCLPAWKLENEYLTRVHSQVLQDVAQRVDRSFQNFFRRCKQAQEKKEAQEKPGFPRFKGRGWYDSFTFAQSGFALEKESVRLSKIGTVQAIVHRQIAGKVKQCTIRRQNQKWFACFSIEVPDAPLPPTGEAIGIDVGLSSFATFSTGEQVENPRFFGRDEKALAKAQRRLSKFE
jgi:putative transposase